MSVIYPTRQDTYAIHVIVYKAKQPTVKLIEGIWDKMTGGEIDSEERKYSPGAMDVPISLGGRKTVSNVVVQRIYKLGRDHIAMQGLIEGVGKSKVVIQRRPMTVDGDPHDQAIVYNGTLKRVQPPEVDSESSEAGLIEIEVTVDGYPKLT